MNKYIISVNVGLDPTINHKDIEFPRLARKWLTLHHFHLWDNVKYKLSVPETEGSDVQSPGNTIYIYFESGDVFENTDDVFENGEESFLYSDFCEFVKEFYSLPLSLQFDFVLYDIQADVEWEWSVYENDFECHPTKGYSSYTNGGAEGPLKLFNDEKQNKEIEMAKKIGDEFY